MFIPSETASLEELERFVDDVLPVLQSLQQKAKTSKAAKAAFYELNEHYEAALSKIYAE